MHKIADSPRLLSSTDEMEGLRLCEVLGTAESAECRWEAIVGGFSAL